MKTINTTEITSATELYAVIGSPIKHSRSPEIHNPLYDEMGLDRCYLAFHIKPEDLAATIPFLRTNLKGFNITIPHKEAIIPFLDELEPRAAVCGAVNTVKIEDGKLKGYNTDGYGFVMGFTEAGIDVRGKKTLILGTGGASRVVAYELLALGCEVTLTNRTYEKAVKVQSVLQAAFPDRTVRVVLTDDIKPEYELIVNTTSVGMSPGEDVSPIGEDIIAGASILYDIVYTPPETAFLRIGKACGCQTVNGASMLFYQGIRSQEILMDMPISEELRAPVYRKYQGKKE